MAIDGRSDIYEILDDRFLIPANGDLRLELLYDGTRWSEGPLYVPAWRQLIFSDVPNDRLLRWDEATGTVGVFRTAAGHPNGNTLDREGRLITCEQGNRRLTRTEHDGSRTVIADRYAGKRFNSPNDVIVRSDGSIWFSDPIFGILSDYEGNRGESEIGASNIYRVDPATGKVRIMADGFLTPNGLTFSPDERRLFVADTVGGHIKVYDIRDDGTLGPGTVFAQAPANVAQFDSVRFDDEGRLWAAAGGGGLHCYAPDGTLIGRIILPLTASNVTFGGPKNNRLFITAGYHVYSLVVAATGAPRIRGCGPTRPHAAATDAPAQNLDAYATRWRLSARRPQG